MNKTNMLSPYTISELKSMNPAEHSIEHSIRLIEIDYMERKWKKKSKENKKNNIIIDIQNNEYVNENLEYDIITIIYYIILKILFIL